MSGGGWGLVVAVVLALVISEFSELSPWLAQKLIRWAARVRYPTRVEELSALIAERPGKLFKLVTAFVFACSVLTHRVTHRKTVPVRPVTSRLRIGLGSALVAGVLMSGERMLSAAIANQVSPSGVFLSVWSLGLIIWGAIAAFAAAAEFMVPSRLPAGWATAVVNFALIQISIVVQYPRTWFDVGSLIANGVLAAAAGVSAACAIRLGNRLRFSIIVTSLTILGCGLLTFNMIFMIWSTEFTPRYVVNLILALSQGFAFGFSAAVGVLLSRVLCGRRLSQSSLPHTAT